MSGAVNEKLVLNAQTTKQLKEIVSQCEAMNLSDWGVKRRGRGVSALFSGPSGTGKTLAVKLIGERLGRHVYRVDCSRLISKYIGETEKNLAALFDRAERRDGILFFDEADALFGKRTVVKDSHDKYANLEVSHLLQRLESFEGLAILATKLPSNIEPAFTRRITTVVEFKLPTAQERLEIWKQILSRRGIKLRDASELPTIAKRCKLSGGDIDRVCRNLRRQALRRGNATFDVGSVEKAVLRFEKAGRRGS